MLGSIISAFTLGGTADTAPQRLGAKPTMCLIVALHAAILAGLLGQMPGLLVGASIALLTVVGYVLGRREFLSSVRGRRMGAAALPAALGGLLLVCVGVYAPQRCAELTPGLFLLMWPMSAFLAVLGGRVVAGMAREEGWDVPPMARESLGVFAGLGLILTLLLAGSWNCTPQTAHLVAYGLGMMLATVAFAGLFEQEKRPI